MLWPWPMAILSTVPQCHFVVDVVVVFCEALVTWANGPLVVYYI